MKFQVRYPKQWLLDQGKVCLPSIQSWYHHKGLNGWQNSTAWGATPCHTSRLHWAKSHEVAIKQRLITPATCNKKNWKLTSPRKNLNILFLEQKPPTKTWIYHGFHVNVPYFFRALRSCGVHLANLTWRSIYVLFQNVFFPCSKGVLFQDPCYWYSGIVSISIYVHMYNMCVFRYSMYGLLVYIWVA